MEHHLMSTTCPACHHSDAHTALIGCLHQDGTTFCDCQSTWSMAQERFQPKTIEDAHQERDAAMAQVQEHTDPTWATKTEAIIRALVADGDFTADDVWDDLAKAGVTAPHEPRALGPILKRLIRAKVIQPMGYTESRRRHGAPIRVYTRTYSGSHTA